jgi:hypothetical protein
MNSIDRTGLFGIAAIAAIALTMSEVSVDLRPPPTAKRPRSTH